MEQGRTKVQVVWDLSAKRIYDKTTEYTNIIHANATGEFLDFLKENGISLEQARDERQKRSDAHNHVF